MLALHKICILDENANQKTETQNNQFKQISK